MVDSDDDGQPTRLYIEGEQVEFDGSLDDIVEMAKSVGGDAFVYVPTKADQEAAAARLAAQDQALHDASGALPQVTLDFDPRHNKWNDAPDPLWLLTQEEYARVPDGGHARLHQRQDSREGAGLHRPGHPVRLHRLGLPRLATDRAVRQKCDTQEI